MITLLIALAGIAAVFYGAFAEVAIFGPRKAERLAISKEESSSLLAKIWESPRRNAAMLSTLRLAGALLFVTQMLDWGSRKRSLTGPDWIEVALEVVITVWLLIVCGDVLPRALALRNPVRSARWVAPVQTLLLWVLWPLYAAVAAIQDFIASAFAPTNSDSDPGDVSEEEFKTMVDVGSARGEVDQRERRMIHRVFEFGDKTVADIMTPRDQIVAVSYDLPMARLNKELSTAGFSRIPVYQKNLDNIRGVLHIKDLVAANVSERTVQAPLASLLHEPLYVPKSTSVQRLFRLCKQKRTHLALVVNEYGRVLGVVTMTDILELLFGSLRDGQEAQQQRSRTTTGEIPNANR